MQALGDTAKSVTNAAQAVQSAWDSGFNDGRVESTTDELIAKVVKASKNVLTSQDIKTALSEASKSVKKTTEEASLATSLATTTVNGNLKSSDKFNSAVENLKATVVFLVSLAGSSTVKSFVGK